MLGHVHVSTYKSWDDMGRWYWGLVKDQFIADDEVRFMWMSADTGAVFAPYDGGVDLILPDTQAVSQMALKHSDWLSSYRDGY